MGKKINIACALALLFLCGPPFWAWCAAKGEEGISLRQEAHMVIVRSACSLDYWTLEQELSEKLKGVPDGVADMIRTNIDEAMASDDCVAFLKPYAVQMAEISPDDFNKLRGSMY